MLVCVYGAWASGELINKGEKWNTLEVGQTTDIPTNTMRMVLVGDKEILLANVARTVCHSQ